MTKYKYYGKEAKIYCVIVDYSVSTKSIPVHILP